MSIKTWIWTIALKKLLKRAVQLGLSFVGADAIAKYGVTIDEAQLIAGLYLALEALRNYAKVTWGWKFL